MSICSVVVLFLLANLPQSEGYISHGFYDFLKLRFGKEYANNVARYDYGPLGSFGGGMHRAGTKTNKTPVVFVAVLGVASIHWGLECHYVNATRTMIKAVAEFTNSTVNVIAYSMGGPVSRKAILGGKCVDTQEDLGPPLTHLVNVYLGVGGANNGALGCLVPAPGVCSLNNGMFCLSSYIRDINSVKRYEGKTIYVLQSSTDELVGYWLCGKHAADIEGSNRTVTLFGFEHLALCTITPFQQYNLIHKGIVSRLCFSTMMRKSRKTANKKPHGHEEEMKTSVAKRNIKTKNAGGRSNSRESTQRASASNVKRKEPTGLTSRFLWRHLENRGIIRRNVLHYMNQHRDDEEDTADLQPETAVPVADHQPKTDKNTTLHSAGDIRVTFINDYCKRGVRVVMREFTQVRSYLPKNLKVEHFNRNSNRNRYADVMCHDETRVILRNRAPDDNYIHASYIRINPKAQTYIATQGPMTETTIDFWQMVVQEKAAVVVMLCNFHEKGEEKCCNYYPLVKGETNTFGKFKVCNSQSGQTGIDTITWSELQVDAGDEKASVYHLLWTDWTDHSAPSDALPVIQLLKLAKSKANGGPIVVHCSAGIGRTGTFIAIDFVNEKLRHSSSVTMQDLIKELRGQRLHAIQSAPQYIFIHVALIEMAISENLIERTPLYRSFQANYNTYLMKLRKKNSARRAIDVPTPVNNPALPNKN